MDDSITAGIITQFRDIFSAYKTLVRAKIEKGEKIKVGFFVIFDSVFPAKPLFEKMLKDEMFDPHIIVIPDVSRGYENMVSQLEKTHKSLSKQYKNIFMSYHKDEKVLDDFSADLDIVCTANPYDSLTHSNYTLPHLIANNVLPIYVPYGYFTLKFGREILKKDTINYFWKVFVDSELNLLEYKENQLIQGDNAVVTGYCKMDDLAKQKVIKRKRKKIILAPHHTVKEWKNGLELSNFMTYSDFFLELPKLYRNIDFVFRPHPLLFVTLREPGLWGKEKTEEYLSKLLSNKNVTYSDGGDYMNVFANSDGMVHDCGSFVAEYLFTGNPSCYILKDEASIEDLFLPMGKKCLEHYYKAFKKEDVIDYIDNVIVKGTDPLKEKRIEFANAELKLNYPDVAQKILDYIKSELTNV